MYYSVVDQQQGITVYFEEDTHLTKSVGLYQLVTEAANQPKNITLDFSKLDFIDSSGIGFILFESKKLMDQGYQLKIRNLSDEIRELFDLLGIPYILGESIFQ
jgi:anti-anti-sigma factor